MKHIEITKTESRNRFNKGENVYIVPCYISGYFGSPLKLNKNMYDELGGTFDDIVDNYIKANCYIIVEEKLKFYRAEREIEEEKRALDEKIIKLYDFLSRNDGESARQIAGFVQAEKMSEQIKVMLEYSNILNGRILLWRYN